ncbi:acyltransferase family protein [Chitinimonas sp. BJB300]|uniref:acyltransferase family protein n=1 Tax=Chitinimonas sp. BJB300 TaxID=1559339 RepID=UPI000C0F1358|nr:acyltransferase [Chitinimonas sp. BJB300]PHV13348.1 acyltransferase [Chitinimonas sp. BJB300]TSJ85264.1 acyltransferase [Chitinimonas sp. BJB300]
MSQPTTRRMTEIDSLRGIAAVLVVLFHYTTRYQELYGHTTVPLFSLPWGHYGVNLFFMISGFVIFMTLDKTRQSLDFVVSRFSRLYPAYWVAVPLTFIITSWLGLPGKTVGLESAAWNLSMFHNLFKVPHVDGVYWTLEVELLFYAWALLAFRLGWLGRIHMLLGVLFALRLGYFGFEKLFQIDLPWLAFRLLILKFIPWFGAGIMIYRLTSRRGPPKPDIAMLLTAIVLLGVVESPMLALLACALSGVLFAVATGRLPLLTHPWLVWLGAISYTLYLLHENIGWAVMLHLQQAGLNANLTILIALIIALTLAHLLSRLVEKPAMHFLRERYKRYQQTRAPVAVSREA